MVDPASGKMETYIIVTWEFEGLHEYPEAPIEVAWLRFVHRHLFKCKAVIEVNHLDRELEFFLVKEFLRLKGQPCAGSCEAMATKFATMILDKYGKRRVEVEVWEDGENGGGVRI